MTTFALFAWTEDNLIIYEGLALFIVAAVVAFAFTFGLDLFRAWRMKRGAWRQGEDTVHGIEDFTRMEPPPRVRQKGVLLGRLTNNEILDIELRMRETRNLAVGPDPRPWQMATLNHTERLAFVDVPRLLAHIRRLEDRS